MYCDILYAGKIKHDYEQKTKEKSTAGPQTWPDSNLISEMTVILLHY